MIDLIITNNSEEFRNSGVVSLGISDHSFIYGCLKTSLKRFQPKIICSRNFKNYNRDGFCKELNEALSTLETSEENNPNTMWDEWKSAFNLANKFN